MENDRVSIPSNPSPFGDDLEASTIREGNGSSGDSQVLRNDEEMEGEVEGDGHGDQGDLLPFLLMPLLLLRLLSLLTPLLLQRLSFLLTPLLLPRLLFLLTPLPLKRWKFLQRLNSWLRLSCSYSSP